MPNFLKRPLVIIIIIVIAIVVGAFFVFQSSKNLIPETAEVEKKDIVQEVIVTGRVQSAESVDLAFEKAGRVSDVRVSIGDSVAPGTVLVQLDSSELLANLLKAKADVKAQEAILQELQRGTRLEELEVQRLKVENAKAVLKDTEQGVVDTLKDAYTKSDDAIRNKVDQVFLSPRSSSPQLLFVMSDSQLETIVKNKRIAVELTLSSFKATLDFLTTQSDLKVAIAKAQLDLSTIKSFLDDLALAINGASSSGYVTQSQLTIWRADVSTARTNVNTAVLNVNTVAENLQSGESTLAIEQQNLVLQEAGSSLEELAAQEAKLEQTRASQSAIDAQLVKNVLTSPIFGIVTKKEVNKGELVGAGVIVISLISDNNYKIETSVPEADIAKLHLGNQANITLDAYGRDVVFKAQIVTIDPAETIIEGVSTYMVTLLFLEEDERVRSGMTANINIIAEKKEGVLAVPQRAVIKKGEEKFVRVLKEQEIVEVVVKTGLRGSNGFLEIIQGLNEGDVVVTFIAE